MTMTAKRPALQDQDERVVEEVHCAECGMPISTIPAWYAKVNVKFICDSCRQKAPRLAAQAAAEAESNRAAAEADGELDPALDEVEVEDVEIEDAEVEVEDE